MLLHICKHIAKAPRANATTKALPKSLQSQRKRKIVFKKFSDPLRKIKNADTQADTDRKTKKAI